MNSYGMASYKACGRVKSELMESTAVSTTTVCWGKVRGFSVELLLLLLDGAKTLHMLSTTTGRNYRYVYRYLYNLKRYGLVVYSDGLWMINYDAIDVIDMILQNRLYYKDYEVIKSLYIDYIYERNMKEVGKKYERSMKEKRKRKVSIKHLSINNGLPKAVEWLKQFKLNGDAIRVVEELANHLKQTNTPFILVQDQYEAAQRFKLPLQKLDHIISKLRELGVIYLHKDVTGKWKIGLKKHFINKFNLRNELAP